MPLRGRDHLTQEGGVWVNVKVLRYLQTLVDIIEGECQEERLDLKQKQILQMRQNTMDIRIFLDKVCFIL